MATLVVAQLNLANAKVAITAKMLRK